MPELKVYELDELPAGKLLAWFKHYIDESNPSSFLNKAGAAKAAGYQAKNDNCFASLGTQNFIRLKKHVSKWMDEVALSPEALKAKLYQGLNAKKVVTATHEGKITDEKEYVDMPTRKSYLQLAMQMNAMLVTRKEVSGPKGGKVQHELDVTPMAAALMDGIGLGYKPGELPNQAQEKLDPDSRPDLEPDGGDDV